MLPLEHIVARVIADNNLLRADAPVIVAVSGGADSVALLAVLDALGYSCVAAHCNYHLRGAESNRDMRSVQQLCASLGIDLYVKDFDVDAHRRATGGSVEMACRELRYDWFGSLLDKLRAQAIAVAHHREDNIETFMLNLLRGSGLQGLTGMSVRNGYVVRPLLGCTRADIEAYLSARNLGFVVDSSNNESVYARNRLRNIVLPELERQFPGASDAILQSIGYLGDYRCAYDTMMQRQIEVYCTGNVIHLAELLAERPEARMILFEIIKPLGFNMTHVDNIIASATHTGISFDAGNTHLALDRGKILIESRQGLHTPDEVEVSLARDILAPVYITIDDLPVTAFKPQRNPAVAYFDKSILDGNPRFALRRWRRGDRITPYGMKGSRLLSDIFSDAKLSTAEKRNVWLLTRDDRIVWVVGIRATDCFAVTPDTRRYLVLTLKS